MRMLALLNSALTLAFLNFNIAYAQTDNHGPGRVACDYQWAHLPKPAPEYQDFLRNCLETYVPVSAQTDTPNVPKRPIIGPAPAAPLPPGRTGTATAQPLPKNTNQFDENGNLVGSWRAQAEKNRARGLNQWEGVPKDIMDAANVAFGMAASQQNAKAKWIGQQMAERWKQESQERMWRGLGADAAQAITRSR
jgi:hypothetical protein